MSKEMAHEVLLCSIFLALFSHSDEAPVYVELNTTAGRIRGIKEKVQSKDVSSFLGIPYAEPPLGDKRFSRPVPKKPWFGIANATTQPNSCPQMVDELFDDFEGSQMWNPNTRISEDCLYMNIWAPSDNSNKKLRAVMIWIFGGSFAAGSATLDIYDGRIMAAVGDVVIVAIQYRMGALGFLHLDPDLAPGNMGLLDQYLAIQWIHKHIESFGGDKNRINLFGESAGAASVVLHIMSPLSQQYVNNIILQSASSLAKWAVDTPEIAKSKALTLAKTVNCSSSDIKLIINCLKQKSSQELSIKMWELNDNSFISTPFVPTIDNYFLHGLPQDIIASGKSKYTKVLLGFNKDEGNYFLIYEGYVSKDNNKYISKSQFKDTIGEILNIDNSHLKDLVAFEYGVPQQYSSRFTYVNALDNLLGDLSFVCSVVDFAEDYTKSGNEVYMYYFNHRTSANPWPEWTGVMHGYEIDHVFGAPLNQTLSYSAEEKQLSHKMLKYWTNFAKSGNPNLSGDKTEDDASTLDEWPAYEGMDKKTLSLDTQQRRTILYGPKHKECTFWREVYPQLKTKLQDETSGASTKAPWQWMVTLLLQPTLAIITTRIF